MQRDINKNTQHQQQVENEFKLLREWIETKL